MAITIGKKTAKPVKRELIFSKVISDFLGKDERILMFRKDKNKTYAFIMKSSALQKIDIKEKPKAVLLKPNVNLGLLLQKLSTEKA